MTKNKHTAIMLGSLIVAMSVLAYASVPLYRMFCQKTGYGGTTQKAVQAPGIVPGSRTLRIQFNGDTNPNLPWTFRPLQHEVTVKAGQTGLAYYEAINNTDYPVSGMATYNVTPDKAGIFFFKVECFCFIKQTLKPRERVIMPVQFFIDPDILKDKNLDDVQVLTLSYTFFPTKDDEPIPQEILDRGVPKGYIKHD